MKKTHVVITTTVCVVLLCTFVGCKRSTPVEDASSTGRETVAEPADTDTTASVETTPAVSEDKQSEESTAVNTSAPVEVVDVDIPTAFNTHGFDLFSECTEKDGREGKNTIISPFSIATALAMTYNGATNETKEQMAAVLHVNGMPLDSFNASASSLMKTLENADEDITLSIANSLWAAEDIPFKKPFISRTHHFYDAAVYNVDFMAADTLKRINGWVEDKTNDKIKDLIKKSDLTKDTLLILINALYFKGIWNEPFVEKRTQDRPFYLPTGNTVSVPIMERDGSFAYTETEKYQTVRLPYGENKRLAMTIVLPSKNSSLDALIAELDAKKWQTLQRSLNSRDGLVGLPRFTLEYEVSLKKVLSQLGMPIAFDKQRADFHPMCILKPNENAYISEVRHKTFIEVNEKGTEAAAATGVVMMKVTSVMPTERFRMICDRPFFLAISDAETGAILFLGAVRTPVK